MLRLVAELVLTTMYLFAPALVANMAPPIAAKLFPHHNKPVWKRVLGRNKTWRGFVAGALVGVVVLVVQAEVVPLVGGDWLERFEILPYREISTAQAALLGALLGTLALVGDAGESAIKRRLGMPPGESWWPDRIDWLVPVVTFLTLFAGWQALLLGLCMALVAYIMHRPMCIVFHDVGLKATPH